MLRRFRQDRKGGVSIITGACLTMLVAFSAAAVDFGYVFMKGRQLQGMADLAAMAAASNLSQAQQAAQATANSNDWRGPVSAAAVTGLYQPLASLAPPDRFAPGGATRNAARVTLTASADLFFAAPLLGRKNVQISRTATAAQGQLASFSIGTRLADLNGGIANALLSGLTGSSVSLSVMDYNALASTQVDLFQYMNALRTRANLQAASFDRTLSGEIATNQALAAIADAVTSSGNGIAAAALSQIANAANDTPIELGQLLDLGPYGDQDYVNASGPSGFSVNALDTANAVLQLAQAGRQVQLRLKSLIPGIAGVTAWLAIGERPAHSPWLTITDAGSATVRTAQARLYVDTQIAPVVAIPGVATIDLPVFVELASAKANLSGLSCAAPQSLALSVAPSIGEAAIGSIDTGALNDFNSELTIGQAKLIDVLAIQVTGKALIDVGGESWQPVSFSASDIADHTVKTVSTADAITAATSSLLGNLSLRVQVLGLGLGVPAVTSSVQSTLKTVAPSLDTVLNGIEGLMGVGLGQADVWADGVRCRRAALVQ